MSLCVRTHVRDKVRGDTENTEKEKWMRGAITFIRTKFIRALSHRANELSNQRRKFYMNG